MKTRPFDSHYEFPSQQVDDLHKLEIETDGQRRPLANYSLDTDSVSVYFRDLKAHLIEHICASDAVLACVAWLTDPDILNAFGARPCSIIVQKEDFLRPDGAADKASIRAAYMKIRGVDRWEVPGILHGASCAGDTSMDGVRCVGNHNSAKNPAHPRMHNKFVVFCRRVPPDAFGWQRLVPISVWTGSFNFTQTANRSFENAVLVRDQRIAQAYADEWSQIAILSQPLDWTSEWCAPEYRIGT